MLQLESTQHIAHRFITIIITILPNAISVMPPSGQTGRCRKCNLNLSVRQSAYLSYECNSLKMNKPSLLQIGTSGSQGNGMKRSTLGVRRSKVSISQHRLVSSLTAYSVRERRSSLIMLVLSRQQAYTPAYGQEHSVTWAVDHTSHNVFCRLPP